MTNLTPDDAIRIAHAFSGFANTVADYRFAHFDALSTFQEASLRDIENSLRTTSNNVIDLGMNLALDDVEGAVSGLAQVTALLKSDLKKLGDVNKALQIVGVLVQLGTAFATGNPAGIASAIGGAVSALTPQAKNAGSN